ncbi:cofilin-like [Orbicella faveolata]|uniref:cofilin-like n=1 Tax=Orbicella faveolata TaxID=48498 RepID=UPI0009E2BD8D|nr:cofilin-like [Orbicella faveolata]
MFAKIKDKKQHGYAVMMINKEKTAVVMERKGLKLEDREVGTTQKSFDEMREVVLESKEPRYILADVTYEREGAGKKDVVVYIYWCSDGVSVKQKMVYASTNEALKKSFTGIKCVECHDDDEFTYDFIVAKLKQQDRA